MKKSKVCFSLILVWVLIIQLCPLKTYATNIIYMISITPVQQAYSNWCWAACAQMAGKTMYSSSGRTQYSVVNYLYGDSMEQYPNVQGTLNDSTEGSKYVTYYNRGFASTTSAWGFTSIENHMAQNKPIQAGIGGYFGTVRMTGHMVIIYGTAHVEDSTGSYWFVAYIDPDDGQNHYTSFSTFCQDGYYIYDQTVYVSN